MSERTGLTGEDAAFVESLGDLLLLSLAAGQTVEGQRYFVNSHRMVPDMIVSIDRLDEGSEDRSGDVRSGDVRSRNGQSSDVRSRTDRSVDSRPADGRSQDVTVTGTAPRPFDVKLESFLLTQFARGESIAGTWTLRYDPAELPAWTVEIDLGDVDFEADPDAVTLRSHGVH